MKPQEFLRENEFIGDDAHQMHKSHQLHMLREECYHSAANAIKLHKLLGELPEGHDLDAWAAEKISLANDYLKTVTEWLEYDVMGGTNEAMMAGGMEAFSMESAERQYAELLGEEQGVAEGEQNAYEQINQILRSQAPNGDFTDDRYLDWIMGPESIQQLVQQTKLPLNQVRNCVAVFRQHPDPDIDDMDVDDMDEGATGNKPFDTMLKGITGKTAVAKQRTADTKQQSKDAFNRMFDGGNPAANLGVKKPGVAEDRTETKDKDGNVVSWRDEGEWEPTNPKKNPQGKVHNLTGQALKKTKELPTLDQDLDRIAETFSSSISTAITPGSGDKTGTLFGGTYKNPSSPFRKKSAKKESMIKR